MSKAKKHYVVSVVIETEDKADFLLRGEANGSAAVIQELLLHAPDLARARVETFPGLLEDVVLWASDRMKDYGSGAVKSKAEKVEADESVAKGRVTLDFDGVVHSYTSLWEGSDIISDPPVKGAFDAIRSYLDAGLKVAIHSSRSHYSPMGKSSKGIEAMKAWFALYGFDRVGELEFPTIKPPSLMYIDDRAWRFNGTNWPSPELVIARKPWNKG